MPAVIPSQGRVAQGRCLSVSKAAVLDQTGLFSVVRLPRQLGQVHDFQMGSNGQESWEQLVIGTGSL